MYLLALELGPPSSLELLIELRKVDVTDEVDKAVANIALVPDVTG